MVPADTKSVIERAKRIYAERLRAVLEPQQLNRFVAIEPESGEYFLADTFDEAVRSARAKYPSRLSHTIRIGHRAAFHLGGLQRCRATWTTTCGRCFPCRCQPRATGRALMSWPRSTRLSTGAWPSRRPRSPPWGW